MIENKITFEDIQKANNTIITTDIEGKDYAEVNQRIKAFRMVYPTGPIETEMISNENGICIFKATVRNEDGDLLATGTAYEKENSTFINKTSYIENCETSAVGRALGLAGFGIDTSIASAEEVQNAMANQEEKNKLKNISKTPYDFLTDTEKLNATPILETQKQRIISEFSKEEIKKYLLTVGVSKLGELTFGQADEFLKIIDDRNEKKRKEEEEIF